MTAPRPLKPAAGQLQADDDTSDDGFAVSCADAGEPGRNWCLACVSDCPEDCSVYGLEEEF